VVHEGDVGIFEAVVKAIWGTDTRCKQERAEGERLVADAETKIAQLQRTLDEAPPRNLDEAVYEMTRRREG
jgi:hypothetical protein